GQQARDAVMGQSICPAINLPLCSSQHTDPVSLGACPDLSLPVLEQNRDVRGSSSPECLLPAPSLSVELVQAHFCSRPEASPLVFQQSGNGVVAQTVRCRVIRPGPIL